MYEVKLVHDCPVGHAVAEPAAAVGSHRRTQLEVPVPLLKRHWAPATHGSTALRVHVAPTGSGLTSAAPQ